MQRIYVGKKALNSKELDEWNKFAIKNYLFLSFDGNTTPWAWKLPVRVFRFFKINALSLQGHETLDKFVFLSWMSEKSIMKILEISILP